MLDYDGKNFGINASDGYVPLAIEEITNPGFGEQYLGHHVLLGLDTYSYSLAGFIFDQNGSYVEEILELDNNQIYLAEELFQVDLNNDFVQGRNFQKLNEHIEIGNYDYTTFDEVSNLTDLYRDISGGDLYFAAVDDPTNKIELFDYDGYNFVINQSVWLLYC